MPTPRKPTAVLQLSGSLDKHPERIAARANEPKPDPVVGNAPRHLNKAQRAIWRELMEQIPPLVATKADRMVIEIAVRMVERMRHAHVASCVEGCPGEMKSSDYATLNRCLSQLGMTPADRSKIQVVAPIEEKSEDPFAEFAQDIPADVKAN